MSRGISRVSHNVEIWCECHAMYANFARKHRKYLKFIASNKFSVKIAQNFRGGFSWWICSDDSIPHSLEYGTRSACSWTSNSLAVGIRVRHGSLRGSIRGDQIWRRGDTTGAAGAFFGKHTARGCSPCRVSMMDFDTTPAKRVARVVGSLHWSYCSTTQASGVAPEHTSTIWI